MKGNAEIIAVLNKGLALELVAVNTYFVQAKMCKNWGYLKLFQKHYAESMDEMRHAESLIDRILFLEGTPQLGVNELHNIGKDIPAQLKNDLALETSSVKIYNDAAQLCVKHNDAGSRELIVRLLAGSEEHVDWLEAQLNLIAQVGAENYLAQQIGDEKEKS